MWCQLFERCSDDSPIMPTRCRQSWRQRLLTTSSAAESPTIVCFVASHVRNTQRAQQLARMLQSVAAQSPHPPPPVGISWSATAEVAPLVRKAISAAMAAGLDILSLEQTERHSQFQHLCRLCEAHSSNPPRWIMFSDDDDLWSETRTALYARECAAADEAVVDDSKSWYSSGSHRSTPCPTGCGRFVTWHATHCCALCELRPGQHGPRCIPTAGDAAAKGGTSALASTTRPPRKPDAVLCRRKAMPLHTASGKGPPDADAVRRLLAKGSVRLTDCNLPDGLDENEHNMAEYFDSAVRYTYLRGARATIVLRGAKKALPSVACPLPSPARFRRLPASVACPLPSPARFRAARRCAGCVCLMVGLCSHTHAHTHTHTHTH
jgi:hypothetical protein